MAECSDEAWNNFVMVSDFADYELGSEKRNAAIASMYMGLANNGGLNSFLTGAWDIDSAEVQNALEAVGATVAAEQFGAVLRELGVPLPAMWQDERWAALESAWSDKLDDLDVLSQEADKQLLSVLVKHVKEHEAYYLQIGH